MQENAGIEMMFFLFLFFSLERLQSNTHRSFPICVQFAFASQSLLCVFKNAVWCFVFFCNMAEQFVFFTHL